MCLHVRTFMLVQPTTCFTYTLTKHTLSLAHTHTHTRTHTHTQWFSLRPGWLNLVEGREHCVMWTDLCNMSQWNEDTCLLSAPLLGSEWSLTFMFPLSATSPAAFRSHKELERACVYAASHGSVAFSHSRKVPW